MPRAECQLRGKCQLRRKAIAWKFPQGTMQGNGGFPHFRSAGGNSGDR